MTGTDQIEKDKSDFALAHRIIAYEGMHEGVHNHLTLMTADPNDHFFVTPGGFHFSDIDQDDVLVMSLGGALVSGGGEPNESAWCLHAPIHKARPDARCAIHLHSTYSTALMMRADSRLNECASQAAAIFYNDVSYYDCYDGALREEEEGVRMAETLGEKSILVLRNHGFFAVGASMGVALERAYFFERACKFQLLAETGGHRLNEIPSRVVGAVQEEECAYLGRYFEGMRRKFHRLSTEDRPQ
ncbi:MAG: class II aldolase/adducin family protein [Pseudomonadota bacterium]